jgi:hypothetical protein
LTVVILLLLWISLISSVTLSLEDIHFKQYLIRARS